MKCLFKYDKNIPKGAVVVDTTSNSGEFRELSPFVLSAPPAKRFENLWQFSKVYADQVYTEDNPQLRIVKGNPTNEWFWWRKQGFEDYQAHRYPKGKGAIPLYSIYPQDYDNRITEHLGYIEARKRIYIPEYSKNVVKTKSYARLKTLYESQRELVLLDYDAYDHQAFGMTLKDVVNNPDKKCGHAFVLMMMLTGELENIIE